MLLQQIADELVTVPEAAAHTSPSGPQVGAMIVNLLKPLYVYGVSAVQSQSSCDVFIRVSRACYAYAAV